MALQLVYPLKKGTYKRFRGYASHVKWNPGTWYGDDDSCKVGTQGYAEEDGYVSLSFKRKTGGGWSFLLNFTKYPGWGSWHAHNSQIPKNGQRFKRGQKMFKTGATGGVTGPHLHHSILHREGRYLVPKNLDSKSVVKWGTVATYLTRAQKKRIGLDLWGREPSAAAYKLNLTYEDLIRRAYGGIKTNYQKLNILRDIRVQLNKDKATLKTTISQQNAKLKTLAGQVKNLQDVLKELPTQQQIDDLEERLEACQEGSQKRVKEENSLKIIWLAVKDLFKRR